MSRAVSDYRRKVPVRELNSPFPGNPPHRLLDRLVYLPGALVLIYGLWLMLTA